RTSAPSGAAPLSPHRSKAGRDGQGRGGRVRGRARGNGRGRGESGGTFAITSSRVLRNRSTVRWGLARAHFDARKRSRGPFEAPFRVPTTREDLDQAVQTAQQGN